MINPIITFVIALPIGLAIDLLWIGVVANKFYRSQLGGMFTDSVNWAPALIFYCIYIAGLVYFVINPAIGAGSLMRAVLVSAFFGLIAYATYDLTNLAVLRNWPLTMSLVDMAWGVFMTATVSGATYLIATTLLGK